MDVNLAKHIIDEAEETQFYNSVAFHIMGEPLLHPHVVDLTKYASQKGLKVHLITNGSLLGNKIDDLLDARPARITISLETPSEESFKLRRSRVMDYEQYIQQIRHSIRRKIEKKANTELAIEIFDTTHKYFQQLPREMNIVSNRQQLSEAVTPWFDFAEQLRMEYGISWKVKTPKFRLLSLALKPLYNCRTWEILPGLFLTLRELTNWGNTMTDKKVINAYIGTCEAFEVLGVLCDGRVVPCCIDYDGKIVLGDVTKDSLKDILRSEKAEKLRKNLNRCILTEPYCRRCVGGTTLVTWLYRQLSSIVAHKLVYRFFREAFH